MPPVPHEGHLLVDGGVTNNLPVDVLRDLSPCGEVIAVDVVPASGPRAREDYGLWVAASGRCVAACGTDAPTRSWRRPSCVR
jgi:predicted acylesterase/phospholipase RssA